jgi:hypothetical protein
MDKRKSWFSSPLGPGGEKIWSQLIAWYDASRGGRLQRSLARRVRHMIRALLNFLKVHFSISRPWKPEDDLDFQFWMEQHGLTVYRGKELPQ